MIEISSDERQKNAVKKIFSSVCVCVSIVGSSEEDPQFFSVLIFLS